MFDSLDRDHIELDGILRGLFLALDSGEKGESFAWLDLLWARLAVHIRAEHLCLFPSILSAQKSLFTGSGAAPRLDEAQRAIGGLRDDHEFFMRELARAISTMRALNTTSDPDAIERGLREVHCITSGVRARLSTHNQFEESHVYRWINVLLDKAGRATLETRVRRELENLPPRFSQVTKEPLS